MKGTQDVRKEAINRIVAAMYAADSHQYSSRELRDERLQRAKDRVSAFPDWFLAAAAAYRQAVTAEVIERQDHLDAIYAEMIDRQRHLGVMMPASAISEAGRALNCAQQLGEEGNALTKARYMHQLAQSKLVSPYKWDDHDAAAPLRFECDGGIVTLEPKWHPEEGFAPADEHSYEVSAWVGNASFASYEWTQEFPPARHKSNSHSPEVYRAARDLFHAVAKALKTNKGARRVDVRFDEARYATCRVNTPHATLT